MQVAMLGTGAPHTRHFARQLQQHPKLDLVAIWAEPDSHGQQLAAALDVTYAASLPELLARQELAGVVVPGLRPEVMTEALAAGKAVLGGAVLAADPDETQALSGAVETAGLICMPALGHRMRSQTLLAKQAVDEGWLGHVSLARIRLGPAAVLGAAGQAGGADPAAPGSASMTDDAGEDRLLADVTAHGLDLAAWLLGEATALSVTVSPAASMLAAAEQAVVTLEFASGALAVVDATLHSTGPTPLEVYGTEGALVVGQDHSPRLESRQLTPAQVSTITRHLPDPLPSPTDQWLEYMESGRPPTVSVYDGHRLVQMVSAAGIAATQGERVSLV